jgi:hypothetical protein
LDKKQSVVRPWPWPDSLEAIIAAENHHRVLLENDRVCVLEVRIPRGDTVRVHTHRWPSTIYVASASNFVRRDGNGNMLFDSCKSGSPPEDSVAQWVPPLPPHSVENVAESEILLSSTELKEPGS